ncbi:hypothetical protein BHE74_00028714 [Ensete ventricosum]|nr:hypothetical protein BHE74_00028714 [Ensete ventricosum]
MRYTEPHVRRRGCRLYLVLRFKEQIGGDTVFSCYPRAPTREGKRGREQRGVRKSRRRPPSLVSKQKEEEKSDFAAPVGERERGRGRKASISVLRFMGVRCGRGPAHLTADSFLDSSRQLGPTPQVAPSRIAGGGGQSQSSSASGIFFQGDGQSQTAVNSMTGNGRSGLGPVSGDMNPGVLNSTGNSSGPSVGASSLITDANSALSGPQLRRSTSINNESYMHLPASPMSFSSNNISGSSMMDGSIMQQSLHQEQACNKQGASSATSDAMAQAQEPVNSTNTSKRARLDFKKDNIMQQQVIQQLLLRPEPVLQGHQNPQLQAILQQQRLAQLQQHHLMQSLPQMQQAPITVQQQQQQRHHMQQQAVEAVAPVERYVDSVIGSRRLMQYLYHQRHRPADAWQCELCGLKSGKGFG